jgi:hypothetical protein
VVSSVLSHDRDKSLTFFLWRVWCLTKSDLDDFFVEFTWMFSIFWETLEARNSRTDRSWDQPAE